MMNGFVGILFLWTMLTLYAAPPRRSAADTTAGLQNLMAFIRWLPRVFPAASVCMVLFLVFSSKEGLDLRVGLLVGLFLAFLPVFYFFLRTTYHFILYIGLCRYQSRSMVIEDADLAEQVLGAVHRARRTHEFFCRLSGIQLSELLQATCRSDSQDK